MQRFFQNTLRNWKSNPLRTPLIVRGARQVGKTYAIQSFGQEEFDGVVTINFEESPGYCACFEEMHPQRIVAQIELLAQQKIVPGKTLLFLDEIQQCPNGLKALRYFKERLPELHVVAAGSLLEFAIQDDAFSFPVGRIQFARLYPLCFEEYLMASGDQDLREKLSTYDLTNPPPPAIHNHLIRRLHDYFVVGGMPEAVKGYLQTHSFLSVKQVQHSLWTAFEADFGKYAKKSQHSHLQKLFAAIPRLLGDHVKYSRIDPELPNPAREMKRAVELLRLAGLLHPIYATSGGALPLLYGLRETVFKLLCLDIGFVHQAMQVDPMDPGMMAGPLAEQFVGQELLAATDPLLESQLFFWSRERGSAEVDYLFPFKGKVYPIEVKAGKSGKLKSLHLFVKEKGSPLGVKVSPEPLNYEQGVLTVPLYLVAHLPRLLQQLIV